MGKAKPSDLEAYLVQTSKQKAPESPVVFHLAEYALQLDHTTDSQRIFFLASQPLPHFILFRRYVRLTDISRLPLALVHAALSGQFSQLTLR